MCLTPPAALCRVKDLEALLTAKGVQLPAAATKQTQLQPQPAGQAAQAGMDTKVLAWHSLAPRRSCWPLWQRGCCRAEIQLPALCMRTPKEAASWVYQGTEGVTSPLAQGWDLDEYRRQIEARQAAACAPAVQTQGWSC